jgi:hypothetical protein
MRLPRWIVQRFFELAVEHERERVKLARDEERQHDGLAGLRDPGFLGVCDTVLTQGVLQLGRNVPASLVRTTARDLALCEAHSLHQRAKARFVVEVVPRRLDVEKYHHRIARLERSLEPRDGL